MTDPDLANERIGQAGQRVVERIADVAVPDRHAVRRSDELDPLASRDRPIDLGEGFRFGRPAVAHGVRDVAQGRADGAHPGERGVVVDARRAQRGRSSTAVTDAPPDQPGGGIVERFEVIHE